MPETKECALRKVYPVGYGVEEARQYIDQLMKQADMLLIDTRFRPNSWRAEWRETALRKKYGNRYHWAGTYLGNVNYAGGPIQLADSEEGIRGLCLYLKEGHDLILLCQCPNYHTCHRKVIVDLLVQQTSVEVIHPEHAGRNAATITREKKAHVAMMKEN